MLNCRRVRLVHHCYRVRPLSFAFPSNCERCIYQRRENETVDEQEKGTTKRKRAERDYQIEGASVHRETSGRMPLTDLATKFLSVLVKHISQHWAICIISKNHWAINFQTLGYCPMAPSPPPPPWIRQCSQAILIAKDNTNVHRVFFSRCMMHQLVVVSDCYSVINNGGHIASFNFS